jgi:hypothetical protein
MTVQQNLNPENPGPQVSPIAARDSAATEADCSHSNHDAHLVRGQSASPLLKSVCKHCRRPITRDLDYELHLPAEGQRWYHDDFVDGAIDAPCTGVSCQNETADQDATDAEPISGSVCKCEAFRESAGTGSAMASPHFPDPVEGGADLASRRSALDFYRPRFLVLPTGRTIFAWGIWDSQKQPASIPTRIFQMSDFVKRFKAANLGKAYAFARRLNEKHEQKRVA